MVFQTYAIWPHMNVFDDVAYPLQVRKLPGHVIRRMVEKTLRFVRLEEFERRPATKLSGPGHLMIFVSTSRVVVATLVGARFRLVEAGG